jgi:hypothetical protein
MIQSAAAAWPGEASYKQGQAAINGWLQSTSAQLKTTLAEARRGIGVAREEVARLRPQLTAAEEFASHAKAIGVVSKVGGGLLVVPALYMDYSEFYAHSHDGAWSSAYAAENLAVVPADIAADVAIGASVLVGPEAAVVGIGVGVLAAGTVMGMQCVTRWAYDHRQGFTIDQAPGTAKLAAGDLGRDAQDSWNLLPLTTPAKLALAGFPLTGPIVSEAFVGSLLIHSKGWI